MNAQTVNMLWLCRSRLKALRASLEALQDMVPTDAGSRCIKALWSAGQIAGYLESLERELMLDLYGDKNGRESD